MGDLKLGAVETRFAGIIWDNAPVSTGVLVKLAQEALKWKRTTTYTVLKRLCEKGLFRVENGVVEVLVDRENSMPGRAVNLCRSPSADHCRRFWRPSAGERNWMTGSWMNCRS